MKKDLFRCRYWTGKFCTRQHVFLRKMMGVFAL